MVTGEKGWLRIELGIKFSGERKRECYDCEGDERLNVSDDCMEPPSLGIYYCGKLMSGRERERGECLVKESCTIIIFLDFHQHLTSLIFFLLSLFYYIINYIIFIYFSFFFTFSSCILSVYQICLFVKE